VPAMFVFDKSGKIAKTMYGAPPDLHDQIGKVLNTLAP